MNKPPCSASVAIAGHPNHWQQCGRQLIEQKQAFRCLKSALDWGLWRGLFWASMAQTPARLRLNNRSETIHRLCSSRLLHGSHLPQRHDFERA